jgi:succinoglycan biosynthesis protein ExoO
MNPDASVIIPAYNTEQYIEHSISSALGQTLTNIEVIVVDDASTDNTVEVVQRFTDSRLKLITNPQNLGAAGARNQALKAATGKWIAVLDSDDWYAPDRLEKLLEIADAYDADMVADDLYLIRDGESTPWSTQIKQSGETIGQVKHIDATYFVASDIADRRGLSLGFCKPLFKRDFLLRHGIDYDLQMRVTQDFWIDLQCLIKGARFFLFPEPYYYYRTRENSLSDGSELRRLELESMKVEAFCLENKDYLNQHPDLNAALSDFARSVRKKRTYYRVLEPLKSRQWMKAIQNMVSNPGFFVQFVQNVPAILSRRYNYYVLGNKLVFERMYQENL